MERVLYYNNHQYLNETSGVYKKIKGQIRALIKFGYKVDFITFSMDGNYVFKENFLGIDENEEIIICNNKSWNRIKSPLLVKKFLENKNYKYIYIRGHMDLLNSIPLYYFMKKVSNNNIIFEIPTYPYIKEEEKQIKSNSTNVLFSYTLFLIHLITFYLRSFFIRRYVISSSQASYPKINNVKTIEMFNALDTLDPNFPTKYHYFDYTKNESDIIMLVVGNIKEYHGLERVILGIDNYYKQNNVSRKVYLNIVGSTEACVEIDDLVLKLKIGKYVRLFGPKIGDELINEYKKANIGVGTLGLYKIGLNETSPLKTNEYIVNGLPFFEGFYNSRFENINFQKSFKNDSSCIDINEVIKWRDSVKFNPEEMTELAIEEYSWLNQMGSILSKL